MFKIFKKKIKLGAYEEYDAYGCNRWIEESIKIPLGIAAYSSGTCFFDRGEYQYIGKILMVSTEVLNREYTTQQSIYEEDINELSFIERDRSKLLFKGRQQIIGYVRTKNVPDDMYKIWVDIQDTLREKRKK